MGSIYWKAMRMQFSYFPIEPGLLLPTRPSSEPLSPPPLVGVYKTDQLWIGRSQLIRRNCVVLSKIKWSLIAPRYYPISIVSEHFANLIRFQYIFNLQKSVQTWGFTKNANLKNLRSVSILRAPEKMVELPSITEALILRLSQFFVAIVYHRKHKTIKLVLIHQLLN